VSDIKQRLKEKHDIEISRERVYVLVSKAAANGHLRYVAPEAIDLAQRMKRAYEFLTDVTIVRTGNAADISVHVAQTILKIMKEHRGEKFSIAFAGGSLLRQTAKWLSTLLREMDPDALPRELVVLALSSILDYREMTSQPNAIFTYFSEDYALPLKVSFVGLPAPGLVTGKQMGVLKRDYPDIRKAFERREEIDVLVTSAGGCWQLGHSALYKIYKTSAPKSLAELNKAGCIGDVMWRPFGSTGPLKVETERRALTLVELWDLPGFIKRRKRVILSMAPCGSCGRNKAEILGAILANTPPLITHLIADSGSVRPILPAR
jgi:DNA-binding transcriptional regulator LsrR (DeoR family)